MAGRVVAALLILIVASCRGGQKEKTAAQVNKTSISDITVDFDGKPCKGWEITNFGPQGPVYVSGSDIILGMGEGCTGITWKGNFPSLNYEVSLDAKKIEGNDFFCGMTFPAGKDPCSLIIGGWGGTTVGLSNIDGLDASDNSTRTLMRFDKNRWYKIRLSVTGSEIVAWIDSTKVIDLNTANRKLSIRPEVELSKPFGISSWNTTAALRNIKVKRIERSE